MTGTRLALGGHAISALALGWLIALAAMVGWSLLPVAFGWKPAVVVTGSMAPAIRPGDVVLIDPDVDIVGRGTIVQVTDSSATSGSIIHRVVGVQDGLLLTKGDANLSPDAARRSSGDVRGVARLVVPMVGRIALIREGYATPRDWGWVGITVGSALVVTFRSWRGPHLPS